eukprot:c16987_g2_i1.p1 GENE.c16987_g2_i1~~c16987_g2_i1.p1  ORF type:complete len:291 (+),score=42.83 c16987_g2_i1:54-926(+)
MTTHIAHYCSLLLHAQEQTPQYYDDESDLSLFHCTQEELAQLEDIEDLVSRLDQQQQCSETCFAAALVYIDRITTSEAGGLVLNHHTMHKLVLASVLVAHQFLDDSPGLALSFADASGFEPKLVADLKTEFLFMLEFDLMITPHELATYSDLLHGRFSSQHFVRSGLWAGTPPCSIPQDGGNDEPTDSIDYPVISVSQPTPPPSQPDVGLPPLMSLVSSPTQTPRSPNSHALCCSPQRPRRMGSLKKCLMSPIPIQTRRRISDPRARSPSAETCPALKSRQRMGRAHSSS